jgi:hypothetical protein
MWLPSNNSNTVWQTIAIQEQLGGNMTADWMEKVSDEQTSSEMTRP